MSGVERLTPSAARTRQSWETLATPSPAASGTGPKGKAKGQAQGLGGRQLYAQSLFDVVVTD